MHRVRRRLDNFTLWFENGLVLHLFLYLLLLALELLRKLSHLCKCLGVMIAFGCVDTKSYLLLGLLVADSFHELMSTFVFWKLLIYLLYRIHAEIEHLMLVVVFFDVSPKCRCLYLISWPCLKANRTQYYALFVCHLFGIVDYFERIFVHLNKPLKF